MRWIAPGDNLDILQHHIADSSVDLILASHDPPVIANRNDTVLFTEICGESSPPQIQAFTAALPATIETTPDESTAAAGHYTAWGEPVAKLGYVRRVERVSWTLSDDCDEPMEHHTG
jgi:hypothetical protein